MDNEGNFYLTGTFSNTVDFDPGEGTDERSSSGGNDIFLTKYSSDGDYEWTRTWGGTTSDNSTGMALDSEENVYVVGNFQNTVDFDTGAGTDEKTSAGSQDGFLVKYSPDGTYQWVKTWGSTGSDYPEAIAISSDDTLYLVGRFNGTVDFDTGAGTDEKTSAGNADAFFTQYNADGAHVSTNTWGGIQFDHASVVSLDADGNILIGGSFNQTVDFDPGVDTDNRTSALNSDAYLVKYDDQVAYQWVRAWGDDSNETVFNITADSENSVYVGGYYRGAVDFDPGAGTEEHTSSDNSNDAYLSKFTNDGMFEWVKTWGGEGGEEARPGLAFDSDGKLYVPSYFESPTVDFDPGDDEDIVANAETEWSGDFALSIFDSNGDYESVLLWQSPQFETVNRVFQDSDGNIYLAGGTRATTIDFNPYEGEDVRTSTSSNKAFLVKLTATYYQHAILSSGIKVTQVSTGSDASKDDEGIERGSNVPLRLSTDTGIPLADFTADMTTDRDWSGITGSSDTTSYQSVVSGLSTAPGVTGTHSLYVPKKDTDTAVHICPDAQTLEQVTTDCSNGQTYTEADDNVSIVDVNGTSYWLVSGLSGTGGVSVSGGLADTGGNTATYVLLAVVLIVCGGMSFKVIAKR